MSEENACTLTPEITQNELNAFRLVPLFKKSFDEGALLSDLLDVTQKGSIASIENNVKRLEEIYPSIEESLYFASKTLIRETKVWLNLVDEAHKTHKIIATAEATPSSYISAYMERLDQLDDRLKKFEPILLKVRQKRLSTDFSEQIKKIEEQMHLLLFDFVKTKKNVPILDFSISKKVLKKSSKELEQCRIFINKFRHVFEEAVVKAGCSYLIEMPKDFINPILYTKEGNIYIIQERIEHFVGIGSFKNVSRTFEIQHGNVLALTSPRKIFEDTLTEDELKELKDLCFFTSFIEADLLKEVKGKKGIIRLYEACGFKKNADHLFFHVLELFDSCELLKILIKLEANENTPFSNESIVAIARDTLCGLLSLKTSGLIHRDLKSDNILAHMQTAHIPAGSRIIDFNVACKVTQTQAKVRFTLAQIAPPELCKAYLMNNNKELSEDYIPLTTYALDMWAMGLNLYNLFFRKSPFWIINKTNLRKNRTEAFSDNELMKKEKNINIANVVMQLKENWIPEEFSTNVMYPLVKKMLEIDPAKRITAEDALLLFDELAPLYLQENSKKSLE